MDNSLRALGDRLRQLRARHGLTQEEFAQIAGIGYKFYQDIEGGRKKEIWLSTVERLAAAYGLRAWQLLMPNMPEGSKVARKVASSRVHRR
ncbi:helix-turn-helix domain-containing protein [Cerasicoccus fimbriatus]|uniref:helix-turn-helix domain-containing protein n=1 Tax=Cerasicoccus fimbriatus TaxID=3014554 RepID=UPI0022B5721F|nr:helix-turn-helix transcriptional regulator [Cerasicoccus sp. TK19100]